MSVLRYKKRIMKKSTYEEEVYLNISKQATSASLVNLTSIGRGIILPGKNYLVKSVVIGKDLAFLLHDGKCRVLSESFSQKTIFPGELLFDHPNQEIIYRRENDSTSQFPYRYICIARNVYIEALFGLNETKVFKNFNLAKVKSVMDELEMMAKNCEQYSVEEFSVKLLEFLTYLCSRDKSAQTFTGKYSNLIKKVASYPQDYRNLAALQSTFGLERTALTKIFLEQTGRTPMAFVVYSRLMNSCWQLQYTTMSISDIATTNGYNNPAFYSRAFKAQFGMSPAQYRQSTQEV